MRVTLLQTDIAWARPSENIRRAEDMMARADAADLYVLPEMWATGFAVQPEGIAEDEDASEALQWMRQTARDHDCALSGSLAVRTADGRYRNRHYLVTPEQTWHYDKHHLFSHGHEDERYTPGRSAVVARWRGMRLLLQTCYDLRFPVFARYGRGPLPGEERKEEDDSELAYDAIIYVANWPLSRQHAWLTLTAARAIENQCYVVAVNRTGDDPACNYGGRSIVADPKGRFIADCGDTPDWRCVDLSPETLSHMRQRFRVLDDRDRLG